MTSNPYDIQPFPETGDTDPDALHLGRGKALQAWELIEEEVADLFSLFTGGPVGRIATPAKRAYGTIGTARGRSEMVNEAAAVFFMDKPDDDHISALRKDFKSFMNMFGRSAGRRNEIAHGLVKNLVFEGELLIMLEMEKDETYYLMPANYNSNKTNLMPININIKVSDKEDPAAYARSEIKNIFSKQAGKFKYSSRELAHYESWFIELSVKARDLVDRIQALQK